MQVMLVTLVMLVILVMLMLLLMMVALTMSAKLLAQTGKSQRGQVAGMVPRMARCCRFRATSIVMLFLLIKMLFSLAFVGLNAPTLFGPRVFGPPASTIPQKSNLGKAARDNRANQMNPNNAQYRPPSTIPQKSNIGKAARDNRANLNNPNNAQYRPPASTIPQKSNIGKAARDNRANLNNPNNAQYRPPASTIPQKSNIGKAARDNRANLNNPNNAQYRPPASTIPQKSNIGKAARDNRANLNNPNNAQYRPPASTIPQKAILDKAARDNRANQNNPNNAQYTASRGNAPLTGEQREAFAKKSARKKENEGHFENRVNRLAPKDKLNLPAFEHFQEILRRVVPGMSLRKTGSRGKGTAIFNSDWDYHIVTERPMTIEQRDLILKICRKKKLQVTRGKAFTVKPESGASIDFFPPNAEWHDDDRQVQKPGSVQFNKGGKTAVKKLKHIFPNKPGHDLEQLVLTIQREMGWSDRNDSSGQNRFQEAQRRLNNGEC